MTNVTADDLNQFSLNDNLPNVIIIVFYIFFGSVGNVLVLVIYKCDMENVMRSGRLFIPFLAMADLLTLLFNGSAEMIFEMRPYTVHNEIACKMSKTIGLFLVVLSGCIYFAIAVHRYMLICKPHSNEPTKWQKAGILLFTVVFLIGCSVPKYIFSGIIIVKTGYTNITGMTCAFEEQYENSPGLKAYYIILGINSIIWLSIIALCYLLITKKIKERKKMQTRGDDEATTSLSLSSVDGEPRNQKPKPLRKTASRMMLVRKLIAENRLSWMFLIMTALSVVCFAPKQTLDAIQVYNLNFSANLNYHTRTFLAFMDNFYLFNNLVNPMLYLCFDKDFQKKFRKRFCRMC